MVASVVAALGVGDVEDQLAVELADRHVRRIRAIEDLEAVVEERLRLVIGHAQRAQARDRIPYWGASPDHTKRDVIEGAGLQGEGARALHEAAVHEGAVLIHPIALRNTVGAPAHRVGISGEHVARDHAIAALIEAVASVRHEHAVLPDAAQVVVVMRGDAGVGHVAVGRLAVEVEEGAHAEALVVRNAVAVADADALVRDAVL
jgi:hypothetical protein